jgi:hypothetical protein
VGDSRRVIPDRTFPLAPERTDIEPDGVACPEIRYGELGASLDYPRRHGGWARVVFDRWDALRVCRGEYSPYAQAVPESGSYSSISIVRPSTWLRERYEYERRHYAKAYAFNGDVDEIRREFDHYLFCFHDEFVEVTAGGVHFDLSDARHDGELHQRPGWAGLPESCIAHRWECSGITCQIRLDARPQDAIIEASRFCDQSIVQVALELDGRASISQRLSVRTRDGETKSRWRGYFGAVEHTFDGIPSLDELRPLVEEHAAAVRARRTAMGKR